MDSVGSKVPVSVIVVSYNTRDLLRRCLESLHDADEVIVIDNASSDGSAEMVRTDFPSLSLIENKENRGFGAANNQGIKIARNEVVLLLNSDAFAQEGSLQRLFEVFDDPEVVAAGGMLLNPDSSLQESVAGPLTLWAVFCEQTYLERLFPSSELFSPYWQTKRIVERDAVHPQPVTQVMGACLMMRPVELFDERFFLYCEDTELCRRLSVLGKILYVPTATFVHELGSSSSSRRWKSIARYNRGKELCFLIHHGRLHTWIAFFLNRFGALLRLLVWGVAAVLTLGLVGRFRRQAGMFGRVLFAPVDVYAGDLRPRPRTG